MTPRAVRTAAATVAVALLSTATSAQTLGGKGRGLDALDEQRVMARLASDGLTGLLDRDFDAFKVPPAERDQQRAVIELSQLSAATGLKPAARRALAERVARGIDGLVDRATDATALEREAYQLASSGVNPTVTELEYFGDNATAQAQLLPVVETVRHMLRHANDMASAQAKAIAAQITEANVAECQAKLRALRPVRDDTDYSDSMMGYALCISLPGDDPRRRTVAADAVEKLKRYDTPRSGVQAVVRTQVGKMQMTVGDYAAARAALRSVADGITGEVRPVPTPAEQSVARYFLAVTDLLDGKLDAAADGLKSLRDWQAVNYLPKLQPAEQDQVGAGNAMLAFRIASARADAATAPDDKRKINDQAVTILSDLLDQQGDPTLRDLVFDQLATRIPPDTDVAQVKNPLVLLALEQQGFDEFNKRDDQPVNEPVLRRAVAAAALLAGRGGQPGVTRATAVNAAYFVPYAWQYKLHDDRRAAAGYVDFMERFPDETDKAMDCMQHAGKLVFDLHRAAVAAHVPDPEEARLYDRFLVLAINPPYDQKQVALDYADLLRSQGKYAEAVKYYGMVPETDRHYGDARFRQLLALYSLLGDADAKLTPDDRLARATQLQDLAAEVDKRASATVPEVPDDDAKQLALGQVAIARYDAAISARRDLKDPAKSLQWLDGFEDKIKGLSNATAFAQTATVQRVNAYMDQGKTADATAQLVTLLGNDPTAGEGLLFDLIQQITREMDAAKGKNDLPTERQLADNKAQLSGFLVTYAESSKDQKTRDQLPAYRLYDAESKRQAAELTADPAARTANLEAALKQYRALTAAGSTDPLVQLGTGLTQYDLGHYAETIAALGPVLTKVGQPMIDVNGERVANPQYWETYYKQLRAMFEFGKQNPSDPKARADAASAKQRVNAFFVLYGDKTGGPGYHDDFVKLRDEMR
jgi:hypothetical protein